MQGRRRNPDTDRTYWVGQRVVLNAMTSDQFVEWIERRLTEHGVQKVVPLTDTLAKAYRLAQRTKAFNQEIAQMQKTLQQHEIAIPSELDAHARWVLEGEGSGQPSTQSWDNIVEQMVQDDPEMGVTSDDERCW